MSKKCCSAYIIGIVKHCQVVVVVVVAVAAVVVVVVEKAVNHGDGHHEQDV